MQILLIVTGNVNSLIWVSIQDTTSMLQPYVYVLKIASVQNFCGFDLFPNYSRRGTHMKWMLLYAEKEPGQRSFGQRLFAPVQFAFPRPKVTSVESLTL